MKKTKPHYRIRNRRRNTTAINWRPWALDKIISTPVSHRRRRFFPNFFIFCFWHATDRTAIGPERNREEGTASLSVYAHHSSRVAVYYISTGAFTSTAEKGGVEWPSVIIPLVFFFRLPFGLYCWGNVLLWGVSSAVCVVAEIFTIYSSMLSK